MEPSYQVEEREEHAASGSDIREYKGLFKRAVALHVAKKRERLQRCAAKKAMMIDLMKKKAEGFVTKLETRQARYAYPVASPQVQYEEMPPPYEEVVNTEPITKEGWAKMEAARKT